VKDAGNSLFLQNSSLYYIILRTFKHIWRVSQATHNFTASFTLYQPHLLKIYSDGSQTVLDRLIKIMVKRVQISGEVVNLLNVNGRTLSLDLSANYRVRSENYGKNT